MHKTHRLRALLNPATFPNRVRDPAFWDAGGPACGTSCAIGCSCDVVRRTIRRVRPGEVFYIVDQGDGWWHCPSPLRCVVLDGPGPLPDSVSPSRAVSLLVATDPAIVWNGDLSYAGRWGPDHPLCHPIEATNRLVMLAAAGSWTLDLDRDFGVPASPVKNGADSLAEVEAVSGLGMKVSVVRDLPR